MSTTKLSKKQAEVLAAIRAGDYRARAKDHATHAALIGRGLIERAPYPTFYVAVEQVSA